VDMWIGSESDAGLPTTSASVFTDACIPIEMFMTHKPTEHQTP